jgi:photosynthetic reaction center cytochrome c subunit
MITNSRLFRGLMAVLAAGLLAGCERPPIEVVQTGYRGTAMEQVYNPRLLAKAATLNAAPAAPAPASDEGPRARDIYKNVQVLGDLSAAAFTRHMTSITQWVAPNEGCAYCHNLANLADDSKYTKVVARKMIVMNQAINANWKTHVAETGVTCYTCHRGNNIPANVWFSPKDRNNANSLLGDLAGQNMAMQTVAYSSLPFDPFTPYLLGAQDIRVNGLEAMAQTGAAANRKSTKQTEHTFALMVHMSKSLGVNCTYCHNTRDIQSWDRPQRTTSWHGIRMARELNNEHMVPLTATFPAQRLGPKGDVAKVNCTTCHQGAYKPLYGAAMAKDHPELLSLAKPPQADAGRVGEDPAARPVGAKTN